MNFMGCTLRGRKCGEYDKKSVGKMLQVRFFFDLIKAPVINQMKASIIEQGSKAALSILSSDC